MHFIREIFLPVLTGMGPEVKVSLRVYGFYPRGGGEVEAHVRPIMEGASLHRPAFPEKKSVWAVRGISAVANLPLSIAERQKKAAMEVLREIKIDTDIKVTSVSAPSPGTFVFLKAEGGACIAGFSSVGIRGKRAEVVGSEAASAFLQYYHRDGCIDPHLADQIVIYLALAPGTTSFTTTAITPHLLTNLAVIKKFLDVQYTVEGQVSGPGRISIRGAGYSRKCFSG
jgi:RNA 3'-terminal phosphate cyclase (ATP)